MRIPIELRRIRDFGEIINDTFAFVKENFSPLFKPLAVMCSFFVVLSTAAHTYMEMNIIEMGKIPLNPGAYNVFDRVLNLYSGMGLYYLTTMFFVLSVYLVTFSYIAIYIQKQGAGKPTMEEIWTYYKFYFPRCLGGTLVIFPLCMLGLFICLLPGIYLSIVLSLAYPIMIIENASFGYAFNKSFKLIGGNWWFTFGIVFIVSLIIGIGSSITTVPITLINSLRLFVYLKGFTTPVVVIFSLLTHILMLSYALLAIAIGLCYFSFTEQKDGTGLLGRIATFGKSNDEAGHLPTEEY